MTSSKRLSFVLTVSVITLLAAEWALHALYPSLPSLAPIAESHYAYQPYEWADWPKNNGYEDPRDVCKPEGSLASLQPESIPAPSSDSLTLWVLGDSMSIGAGLPTEANYPAQLKAALRKTLNVPVLLSNLASPGANFCTILNLTHSSLDHIKHKPDVIVVQFFADDLHGRAKIAIGDKLVLFPEWVQNPLGRYLVSRSYLANLAWYALAPARHTRPLRYVDSRARQVFVESVKDLHERGQAMQTEVIYTLLAPTGLHLCPDPPPENSRCMWLGSDMDLIAELLDQAEVPWVDLRTLWEGEPNRILQKERTWIEQGRITMGIHPDELGHKLLSDALEPALYQLMNKARLGRDLHPSRDEPMTPVPIPDLQPKQQQTIPAGLPAAHQTPGPAQGLPGASGMEH